MSTCKLKSMAASAGGIRVGLGRIIDEMDRVAVLGRQGSKAELASWLRDSTDIECDAEQLAADLIEVILEIEADKIETSS